MFNIDEAKNKVKFAVEEAMPDIRQLLHLKVNERTISCLISNFLVDFSVGEISVDAEYDKHKDGAKEMTLKNFINKYRENRDDEEQFDCSCDKCKEIKSQEDFKDTEISKRPDIIIHKRNFDDKNYIVIEVKKDERCLWDYIKLKYMTSPEKTYRYRLGIFIHFPQSEPEYIYFINGSKEIL